MFHQAFIFVCERISPRYSAGIHSRFRLLSLDILTIMCFRVVFKNSQDFSIYFKWCVMRIVLAYCMACIMSRAMKLYFLYKWNVYKICFNVHNNIFICEACHSLEVKELILECLFWDQNLLLNMLALSTYQSHYW